MILVDEKHIYNGVDVEKGYKVVDLDALANEIEFIIENSDNDHIIVEGHLAHEFSSDIVDDGYSSQGKTRCFEKTSE